MPSVRVSLLRSVVLPVVLATAVVPSARGATGGAVLPGGALPSEPEPIAASVPPPGMSEASEASQETLMAATPALPVLSMTERRADDPVPANLAALTQPSPVAAIDGHVVIVRPRLGRSELVDLAEPAHPRVLLVSTRAFGLPSAGRDATGRAVVVVSPCAGVEEVVLQGEVPRCPLRAIDLETGSSRALPATTGALMGDLAGDRLVFARRSPTAGVRLYESVGGTAASASLPRLGTLGDGWTPQQGKPLPGSTRLTALDVDAEGRVAAALEYRAKAPAVTSGLWLRAPAGRWQRLTSVATRFTGMGTRRVLAPALDGDGGVRAYVEGVIESPSFVARWSPTGSPTTQLSIRRSIGRATIVHGAAYDGNRLLFVDWLPGAPCGSEGALACGLRALGPLPS